MESTAGIGCVVDLDQLGRVGGNFRRLGRDRHHRLAREPHPIDGDQGTVLDGMPVVGIDVEHIVAGHDGDHARKRSGGARVDAGDLRGGVRAADQLAVDHAGDHQIAGELRFADRLVTRVDAGNVLADGHALPAFRRAAARSTASMMFQ